MNPGLIMRRLHPRDDSCGLSRRPWRIIVRRNASPDTLPQGVTSKRHFGFDSLAPYYPSPPTESIHLLHMPSTIHHGFVADGLTLWFELDIALASKWNMIGGLNGDVSEFKSAQSGIPFLANPCNLLALRVALPDSWASHVLPSSISCRTEGSVLGFSLRLASSS
ncbi:hypothetical protein J3459_009938 [Metarhizium acridum]|nr:hypothetical protein J3459_009938 [Metarhizium acridum]